LSPAEQQEKLRRVHKWAENKKKREEQEAKKQKKAPG
jgi:hypothetical protein